MERSGIPAWVWAGFGVLVAAMLVVDWVSHRGGRADTQRGALLWSAVWIAIGLLFGGVVWALFGGQAAAEYYAAYAIEKSLSVDNLFVFLVIFSSVRVPRQHQRRVLLWGVLGALGFRALFIALGITALERWDWVVYPFGAALFAAAWRVGRKHPAEMEQTRIVGFLARHLPVTREVKDHHFFVREDGRFVATPLLLALVAIELTDIVFAIDSVPAALSVTRQPFLVYSSNVLAVLGMRALYAALAHTVARLRYLHHGLAAVLAAAGLKLVASEWLHVPAWMSLSFIAAALGASILASIWRERREAEA